MTMECDVFHASPGLRHQGLHPGFGSERAGNRKKPAARSSVEPSAELCHGLKIRNQIIFLSDASWLPGHVG